VIRIIFSLLEGRKTVYEVVYLQSLRRGGSLIVGFLGLPTGGGGGRRSPGSKNFLKKIMLDRLTQKTTMI